MDALEPSLARRVGVGVPAVAELAPQRGEPDTPLPPALLAADRARASWRHRSASSLRTDACAQVRVYAHAVSVCEVEHSSHMQRR